MIDYTTLKHQADGTPTWDAFLGIILKVAVERQNWQSSELIQRTLEEVNLPQSMLQMRYPQKSHDLVMRNRVSFALSDLAISGLLFSLLKCANKKLLVPSFLSLFIILSNISRFTIPDAFLSTMILSHKLKCSGKKLT